MELVDTLGLGPSAERCGGSTPSEGTAKRYDIMTLEELANIIKTGDRAKISEASLNRVYQHVKGTASDSFAIITAFRGGFSKKENLDRNKKLESDIRSLGLGFFKVKGYWVECQDDSVEYTNCPPDMLESVVEISFFVPNITKKDGIRLAKKYNQDAIVFEDRASDDGVVLLSKSGKTILKLGKFSPNKIKQAYTKLRGRTFTFEGFQYMPTGQLESLLFDIELNKK